MMGLTTHRPPDMGRLLDIRPGRLLDIRPHPDMGYLLDIRPHPDMVRPPKMRPRPGIPPGATAARNSATAPPTVMSRKRPLRSFAR
jgi:hypothetical protein